MLRFISALYLAIICSAFAFSAAHADTLVYRNGDLVVTLTEMPCTNDELGVTVILYGMENPKMAIAAYAGRTLEACWANLDEEDVFLVDAAGRSGTLPKAKLVRTPLT